MDNCILFLLLVILASVMAPPAPAISQIKITRCDCSSCRFKQIGYGTVRVTFRGSQVRCSRQPILGFGRRVIGWNHDCGISGRSGKFVVSHGSLCGIDYDHVYLNNCSGTPCSAIG